MLNFHHIDNLNEHLTNTPHRLQDKDAMDWFHAACLTIDSAIALKERGTFPDGYWDGKNHEGLCEDSKVNISTSSIFPKSLKDLQEVLYIYLVSTMRLCSK